MREEKRKDPNVWVDNLSQRQIDAISNLLPNMSLRLRKRIQTRRDLLSEESAREWRKAHAHGNPI